VARIEPTILDDAPLGPDDDYDYALEDTEEREHEKMDKLPPLALPHALDFVTALSFGSLGTPSPPPSSEAPSPESTRDFDGFNDDASEFSRRSDLLEQGNGCIARKSVSNRHRDAPDS
jgi:hypothetical protein